jgi:hypothetical protein
MIGDVAIKVTKSYSDKLPIEVVVVNELVIPVTNTRG